MLDFGVTLMPDPPTSRIVELTRLAERKGLLMAGSSIPMCCGWTHIHYSP